MPEGALFWDRRRIGRVAGLAIGLSTLILGLLLALLLLEDRVSQATVWRVKLRFLIVLEVAYSLVLAATLVAIPTLGVVFARSWRRRVRRPLVARWLLLCTSLLFGLVLAETAAAVWRSRLDRSGALPIGGLDQTEEAEKPPTLPSSSASIALRTEFPDPPDDAVNLVVLGESSAEGVPFNLFSLSVGSIVTWQLERLIPGRRFHLEILAQSGETLEGQHRKLAELDRRPDVLIIYCGHNEFSSRLPWSRDVDHYNDGRVPTTLEQLVDRLERTSPLCALIRAAADKCRIAIPPPPGGYRELVDVPAYTPPEYAALLADFRRRLERIVTDAEQVGALPILIIPPANDSGFEPNRSFLLPRTSRAERASFRREFLAARRLEATDPAGGIARYRSLLARQPGFAEVHYRLARLLERTGAWDEAYRQAIAARDCDGLPMRCPTPFQDAYREVAARHDCILIDGQAYFHAIGRHGLLDDHLFQDAMHPSLRGQIALAQAVLQGLRARRAFGWPEATAAPILDPAHCATRFGLGPGAWRSLCLWGAMVFDLLAPAHYDPSQRLARRDAYQSAFVRISDGQAPEAVGLPNVGTPDAIPIIPDAAILTRRQSPEDLNPG